VKAALIRLLGSRKFWVTFSAGIISTGAMFTPFFAAFWGWDQAKQRAFESACYGMSMIIGGLGMVLTIMIGTEDAAEKVQLPPPGPFTGQGSKTAQS
jgi:hypothetical protein